MDTRGLSSRRALFLEEVPGASKSVGVAINLIQTPTLYYLRGYLLTAQRFLTTTWAKT